MGSAMHNAWNGLDGTDLFDSSVYAEPGGAGVIEVLIGWRPEDFDLLQASTRRFVMFADRQTVCSEGSQRRFPRPGCPGWPPRISPRPAGPDGSALDADNMDPPDSRRNRREMLLSLKTTLLLGHRSAWINKGNHRGIGKVSSKFRDGDHAAAAIFRPRGAVMCRRGHMDTGEPVTLISTQNYRLGAGPPRYVAHHGVLGACGGCVTADSPKGRPVGHACVVSPGERSQPERLRRCAADGEHRG
jgi:hypothetical protein